MQGTVRGVVVAHSGARPGLWVASSDGTRRFLPKGRLGGFHPAAFHLGDRVDMHVDDDGAALEPRRQATVSRRKAIRATVVEASRRGVIVATHRGPVGIVWPTEWSWGLEDPPAPGQAVFVRRIGPGDDLVGLTRRRAVCRTVTAPGDDAARLVRDLADQLRQWYFVNASAFGDGRVHLSGASGAAVDLAERAVRGTLRATT
jgi:hypothetical protein